MDYLKIKSITPDPVLESIAEFRFKASVPDDAVFGIVYNCLKEQFPTPPLALPLLSIPEPIRGQDLSLKYKPLYVLKSKENLQVQIGPRVISVNRDTSSPYMGWTKFSEHLSEIVGKIFKTEVFEEVERTAVRYISFFKDINIFDHLKLNVSLESVEYITKGNSSFETEIKEDKVMSRLRIDNSATLNRVGMDAYKGSIVDIDSYSTEKYKEAHKLLDLVGKCHSTEKRLFFSLLREDFLAKLNPEYENTKGKQS